MPSGSKLAVVGNDALGAEIRSTLYLRHERLILGCVAVAFALSLWEGVGRSGVVNPIFLSSPSTIAATGYEMAMSGELSRHLMISGKEFFLGYSMAVLTAIPLGLLGGWYRRLNYVLDPFISALYVTPRVALLPLIVLWLGVGILSKVAVIFLGAFFPICINTIAGVRTVDRSHIMVARSFGGDNLHVLKTIIFPTCVPFMLAGLRLAVGRGLVGVVVGEFYAASAGIGFLITVAGATFQTDKVFVGIAIIAAFGLICNEFLSRAERRVERWRPMVDSAL
jgi:ABC-type nitrate/sulfonate/bicarbonate transport system permease component